MKGDKKVCPQCGTEFEPHKHNQKYCSRECYTKVVNVRHKERYHANKKLKPKLPPKKRICVICGAEFKPRSRFAKTCSRECSSKLRRKKANKMTDELGADKKFFVPEGKMYVRIVSPREEYHFKNLRQAVNFLSVYSSCTAAECLTLLKQHENKIDKWKIFYD